MNWKLEKSIEPDAAIEKIRAGDLEALEQFDTLTQALAARGNYCYTQHCTALHCTLFLLWVRFCATSSVCLPSIKGALGVQSESTHHAHTVHRL
jgi:hypothetical protein